MSINFDVSNRYEQQGKSLDEFLGFNNTSLNNSTNLQQTAVQPGQGEISTDSIDNLVQLAKQSEKAVFDMLNGMLTSSSNGASSNVNPFSATDANPSNPATGVQTPPVVENYGGFHFKNDKEQSAADSALQSMRQAQAANPGKEISQTIKVGKKKLKITLDKDGNVHIKRKKSGFFSKIGEALGKIGKVLKAALPYVAMVAAFIPGLQPLALAAKIASGVMSAVDSFKSGNIFGGIMGAVSAFSGVGGKIGDFVNNLSSKAGGILNNVMGSGAGQWVQNTFNKVSDFIGKGKDMLNTFTGGIGTKVSDFISKSGSNLLGNLTNSFSGKVGDFLKQKGADFLSNFASSAGNRVSNWLNEKAYGLVSNLTNSPLGQKVSGFFNSSFGQTLINFLESRRGKA